MTDAIQQDVSTPLNLSTAAEKILAMDEPPQEELSEEESETEEVESEEETTEETVELEETDEDESASLSEYLRENKEVYETIRIPTKVNGKEGEATLSELIKAYQIGESNYQKADSLASERKQLESQKQELLSGVNQQLEQAKGLVQGLEHKFLDEFNKIDWNELRESDPAEFSAKRQEFLERQQGVEQVKNHIIQNQQKQFTENYQRHISEQSDLLPELIPDWSDDSVAQKEKGEIREYLISAGMPKERIDGKVDSQGNVVMAGLTDATSIMIARKAMLYDRGSKKVEAIKKKVKSLPKIVRPGKTTTRDEISEADYKKRRGKLKKSGKIEDAASLLHERFFGG